MKKTVLVALGLLAIASLVLLVARWPSPTKEASDAMTGVVVKVADGDTFTALVGSERVKFRLIGSDTPETHHPNKSVQCFGKEASARTTDLVLGKRVRFELDPSQGKLDKYGRTLAYVYLPDGRMLNKLLVEEGYAYEYTYQKSHPYRHAEEFRSAQAAAARDARGLWAKGKCEHDPRVEKIRGKQKPHSRISGGGFYSVKKLADAFFRRE